MKSRQRRRPSLFLIAIAGLLVLGVVAIVLSRGAENDNSVAAEVELTGEALPTYALGTAADEDEAVGRRIPRASGVDLESEPLTIGPGRPMGIVFLAHWCPHCQDEVRELVQWLEGNDLPDGVDVVAVSTQVDRTRGNYPPGAWLDREGWPFPTLVDSTASSTAAAFGLAGTPFWVFVDAEGVVTQRIGGLIGAEDLASILGGLAEQSS